MNCRNCGNNLTQNAKFCDACGSPIVYAQGYGEASGKAQPQMGNTNLPPKRLYRSRGDRMIAGVCGGIGEYYNTDPILVRLIFVILFLSGGVGFLAYLIAILIIPESPYDPWKEPKYT